MSARANAKTTGSRSRKSRYWSAGVTRHSNALALEPNVFKKASPRAIAASLKRSAEHSRRRKAGAYQSAMSMLNFYVNRAGRSLSTADKARLQRAKDELRRLFGRERPTSSP
ncbi:MAG: hypothetical protein DMF80_02895 [Acidobacteria bacterium]|nr:MAG: hypothetical protein DMF80_02895 [Acidobacteriota bacterium]PYQ25177.1 MAG: hypothetical protein DMF81_03200 [Acidobacteriota bacterium]